MEEVIAKRRSVSMLILHTAIPAALRTFLPERPVQSPGFRHRIYCIFLLNSGNTVEAPCNTIGKFGNNLPTFSKRSKSRYGAFEFVSTMVYTQ